MANKILEKVCEKNSSLSMSLTGYIVSIPVFCDSGFIVLSALNKAIAKRTKIPLTILAVALASGLYATHVFVPPTPGPLAAAATIGADIGRVLILGLAVSVPVMGAALLWAVKVCGRYRVNYDLNDDEPVETGPSPSFTAAVTPILPGEGTVYSATLFLGDPIIALLIGVTAAFFMVTGGQKKI